MADGTNAERQRRHRRHKAGDHSLCDPGRCSDVKAATVTRTVTQVAAKPVRLGTRGAQLWQDEGGDKLTGTRRVVLEEACRIADRLDRMHAILNGHDRAWLTPEVSDEGEITAVVDKVLSEARQQQLALKQLAAELRQSAGADKPATGGSVLDQLAARRAARRANPPG